jgi:hypothetical protein
MPGFTPRQPEIDGWKVRLYGLPEARQTGYLCAAHNRSKNGIASLAYGRSQNVAPSANE